MMKKVEKETLQRLEAELIAIVEQEEKERIIPFLKDLSVDERRALTPRAKKLYKYYSETIVLSKNTYGSRWSTVQVYILMHTGYVLFTYQELSQLTWSIESDLIEALGDWYVPSWLGECLNQQTEEKVLRMNKLSYPLLMVCIEKGWMNREPEPHLIARLLTQSITVAEVFEEHDITLKEHIWYLFRYDCSQNRQDKEKPYFLFTYFVEGGKLNRMRVMKEALGATLHHFNKNLSGWFAGLFEAFAPTDAELVVLQPELLSTLHCPQSRPVNVALAALKKLALRTDFWIDDFLAQTPILFVSEVKSIHQATLAILMLLVQKNVTHREAICCSATQALMSRDESTQGKVVKLISGYGEIASSSLRETLAMYEEAMLTSTRKELEDYLSLPKKSDAQSVLQPLPSLIESALQPLPSLLCDENQIPEISSADDFLFLASQVLHCNELYHFDFFISELLRWDSRLTGAHIAQFLPVFQRAYKMATERQGNLDEMLALFLIEYGLLLEKRFPCQAEPLRKLRDKHIAVDHSLRYGNYQAHQALLGQVLEQLKDGVALPLLSTPTHAPAWIAPSTLIQRLRKFSEVGAAPNDMDMQIALSRIALPASSDDLKKVKEELKGEFRALLLFLLGGEEAMPQPPFEHPSWWMVAGLIKSSETVYPEFTNFVYSKGHRHFLMGNFTWKNDLEPYSYTEYNGKVVTGNHSKLELKIPKGKNVEIKNWGKYNMEIRYRSFSDCPLLVETFWQLISGWEIRNQSLARFIWLSPNLPEPILSWIILHYMGSAMVSEVTEVTALRTAMETFYRLHHSWQETSYLFASGCLLVHDKSTRTYAAELWVERVNSGLIDNERVGRTLSRLLVGEWAPMKRLTDLIMAQMLNISPRHHRELERLLTSLIAGLPQTPIRGLKKMLEIYSEVLALNESKVTDKSLLDTLNGWMSSTPGSFPWQ